jgi:short subunit dehydrogenase-like uncharacterized protein
MKMIPQAGIDSVPTDVVAYLIAKCIRDNLGVGTGEVVCSLEDIKYVFKCANVQLIGSS